MDRAPDRAALTAAHRPVLHLLGAGGSGRDSAGENESDGSRPLRDRARLLSQGGCASRSYRDGHAVVALAQGRVGVDIERVDAVAGPGSPADRDAVSRFLAAVATPQEARAAARERWDATTAASLWSSKEALAKALGDPLAYDPARLDGPAGWALDADGVRRAGRWSARPLSEVLPLPADLLGWLVWESDIGGTEVSQAPPEPLCRALPGADLRESDV